ncbi:MAG: hypothetical protein JSV23_03220 [Promethearchaeota archaeon]|nr:MAG: hypothetical protein JSV23_03220 [Candidatus Lokiarchaeota archaeon]
MVDKNNLEIADLGEFIKEANEKIDKFASILEKFGLDIITKMGQTNLKINMLTDKINELNKATIDIKSLAPQLNNVIENQRILEAELDLIRSLIQRSDISFHSREYETQEVERDVSATDKKQLITEQFNNLKNEVDEIEDPEIVIERLENIKEDIFIFKGGHRILYEIAQFVKKLNGLETIPGDIKEEVKEKIVFWINKL